MRAFGFFAFLVACFPFSARAELESPTIVVIFTDDHGWPDLGSVGIHKDLKTRR